MPSGHTCEHGIHGCAFCRIEYEVRRQVRTFLFNSIYKKNHKQTKSERNLVMEPMYPQRRRT